MEYRKYGKRYVIRIDRGEEVIAKLKELCEKEEISLASIEGLGAADHVVVGLYNVEKKEYKQRVFDEEMEITSIIGNITLQGKKVYQHIHITVCNAAAAPKTVPRKPSRGYEHESGRVERHHPRRSGEAGQSGQYCRRRRLPDES